VTELGPEARAVALLPDAIREGLPDASLTGASQWPGGVWFDLNGHLTWAYASLDGKLPGARDLAWDEYTRNTLAKHAELWPDHWDGTISVDDVCHAFYGNHPESCGTGLSQAYAGQITEQPTWMVMGAIRLAGITPTERGYDIDPHLPFNRFSLRMPRIGVAADANAYRGYLRPAGSGRIELAVHLPDGVDPARVTTWSATTKVDHTVSASVVHFTIPGRRGRASDWSVSW
jgi:hypothetical protein